MSDLILGVPALEFVIQQEKRINSFQKQIERVVSKKSTHALSELQKALTEFKGNPEICKEPILDTITNAHLCRILIPYYAGIYSLLIRDFTRVSRLLPGSVYLAAFIRELKRISILQDNVKRNVEDHHILVTKLINSDNKYIRKVLIDFLVSCSKNAKRILKTTGEEVMRTRTDVKKRDKLQDISVEEEADKVYEFVELPAEPAKNEEEDEEEEYYYEYDEGGEDADLEKRADFQACVDLFNNDLGEAKKAEEGEDALSYVPEHVVDFTALHSMVMDEFYQIDNNFKPFFVAKMIHGIAKYTPEIFNEVVKPYRKQ
ncbi:hypothetical protein TVAG_414520 [Trichomonas vaginalis G3]|uniref:Uncharacterized protein n=1 Tax=Trichomonas vaginalis (strain ATCC PRA-98 / G3) TaxID=412133 RepID=A2FDS1_TRIV3|nr:hypothetical protein TVAGG3_0563240 [Trichomonas vaginalis G3]EAX96971.1 hypothetical protein TVAG_414520 [Trichomonas vaginalis G3]KAI5521369.1 hypothetical protein TVAGG3_0563240 [Trichomonas vaginalis G3]|eukprot:XP_001309901.1 hypothetical protein [Trichomonas vaginalis G3]